MELMPVDRMQDRSLELRATDAMDAEGAPPQVNPLERVHSLLRGRYKLAIFLGIVLAAIGAAIGFKLGKPDYQSIAQLQIKPVVPTVMYQSADPEKQMMPMFDSYVDTQAQLLQSPRVVDVAINSDLWKKTGHGTDPDVVAQYLDKNLIVSHQRGSELIQVKMIDKTPQAAQAGLQSIIDSYRKIYVDSDSDNGQKRMDILQALRDRLNADYLTKRQELAAAAQGTGTTDLGKQYDFQTELVEKYESALKQMELQAALASVNPSKATTQSSGMTADQMALQDPAMARMLEQQQVLQQQLAILSSQGFMADHPRVKQVKAQLRIVQQAIAQRVSQYNAQLASGQAIMPNSSSTSGGLTVSFLTPAQLAAQRDKVQQLYDAAKKELLTMGRQRLTIDSMKEDEAEAKKKLDDVQTKIDQINVENQITGRIEIDRPSDPIIAKDMRLKFAGGGGFLGLVLGFGIVGLIGAMDRRFHSPADAKMHMNNSPILGVLPNLPDDLSDPEQAAVTAHYVHQIRTLLQIWDSGHGKQVFSITSPVSGTGKTSLALALGVSFAAASKTLLIDCDLVGGGLTHRANAIVKQKIGRILQKEGLLTERQLEESLRLAHGSRRRLGEILVELGYLKERDITQALVTQQKASVGLLEAINGEDLEECIAETGIANLYVLALGNATAQHISRLTPQAVRKLLDRCKEKFDTILIDSGPIPGSLEASSVVAEVDGVILCVSRGEQRPLAERCVQHLNSLGARVAGIVFNRARSEDMILDGTTIRGSQPMSSDAGAMRNSAKFGPMARAVASAAMQPAEENGNGNGNGNGKSK